MITHNRDGSYTLVDDTDPKRTQTLAKGMDPDKVRAAQLEFFGPGDVDPASEIEEKLAALGLNLDDLRAALK